METLQQNIVRDLKDIEDEMGSPSFQWQGSTYNFIPSITEVKRDLDNGGFVIDLLMSSTVRSFDIQCDDDGEEILVPTFLNGYPSSQQKIVYTLDGNTYRIQLIKMDPTNSYFRMIGVCPNRGI